MIDVLVKDNYFKNPDEVRKIGLHNKTYRINNSNELGAGWRGQRTLPIRQEIDHICQYCNQKKIDISSEEKFIIEESEKIFDLCSNHYNFSETYSEKLSIISYFHITTEKTKLSYTDLQDVYHKDQTPVISGIVYLTPNAPPNAGTSIVDVENHKFINVENKYNRLVAYDGSIVHGLSDFFGNCEETGRMTLTFFIHKVIDTHRFN
jgi:hypothetical protein